MSIQVIFEGWYPLWAARHRAAGRADRRAQLFPDYDPLAPVTVVVPTNIAGLAARRDLGAQGRGIAAVSFLKLFDLAERLAGRRMADEHQRKPLSDPVVSATVRNVLNTEPGLFQASAHHPATEQALVRSYRDLRDLSDESLGLLAGQSRRAADVVRICRQARDKLRARWYDGQDLIEEAVKALRSDTIDTVVADLGPVIVHLPQKTTRAQGRLISTLALKTPVTVIAGLSGDDKADAAGLESVHRMGAEPAALPSVAKPCGHRVISTASVDEEIRVAVRDVVNAARQGVPLSRIAVLCGGGSPTIRQLQEHLDAAGIQCNGPSGRTLADSLVGRGLLALLDLENRDYRRDEVFALLSAASPTVPGSDANPDIGPNANGREPAPVMAWERASRQAGVARGPGQWTARLEAHAAKLREHAEDADADPADSEYRADRLRREAGHADSLARFMVALIDKLSPDPEPNTWKKWCHWIKGLIHSYLGDERTRQDWPDQEQEAAKQIEEIVDRLATLDMIEHHPRPATFRHTLASELGTPTSRVGQVGQGVLTGRIGDSLGMQLDRVILIGMAEGVFPHCPLDDPLLPDRERKAAGDDLALLSDRVDEQHRHLLVAMASAQVSTLVFARGDSRRGSEQHPSRWLLDTATARAGQPVDSTSLEELAADNAADWFEQVPSFSGRVLKADFPATDQEFRLQAHACGRRSEDMALDDNPVLADSPIWRDNPVLADSPIWRDDPVLARGAELVSARASNRFTRFDGNLAGLSAVNLTADAMSPTSLEMWADCPMRYLFRHILRVQAIEQPEELLEISARDKGSLIHKALEEFMQEQLELREVPPPNQPWRRQQHDRLQEIGLVKCQEAEGEGLTGSPVYWRRQRDQIMADLDRFLSEDNRERQEHGAAPIASELSFGMPDSEVAAIPVSLPGNRKVRFKGRADRVDQAADKSLLITDYKTGKAASYKSLDESRQDRDDWDPVQRGTRLQLPVYGLAARALVGDSAAPVRAQYWFVTGDENFQACGYRLGREVLGRFRTAVATIVEGIEAGVFCDRPDPGSTRGQYSRRCEYCNADRLGTEHQRRAWERMQHQAELADYRNLAEPPPEDPDAEAR